MRDKCRKLKDKILASFVDELRQSIFYQTDVKATINRCLKELGERKISQIVCYGLGSFHNGVDVTSRFQLALLILLYEHLLEHGSPVKPVIQVYDPSFEQLDIDTLASFTEPQFGLIPVNEYCARKLEATDQSRCTLFYMPHLDKFLYNNLLGSNWLASSLSQLIVLGNSFTEMIDNEIPSKCKTELHFLNLLVNNFKSKEKSSRKFRNNSRQEEEKEEVLTALVEIPLDDSSFEHQDIFNSFAFHFVNKAWLAGGDSMMRIQQNCLPNWTYVTSCSPDD